MLEQVLRESASDLEMQEIMEVYADALSPILNVRYLLAAVLERAILDLELNVATQNYEWFRDALIWFEGAATEREECSFTYEQILSTLNLTATNVKMINEKVEKGKLLHVRIRAEMKLNTPVFYKSKSYMQKIINEK